MALRARVGRRDRGDGALRWGRAAIRHRPGQAWGLLLLSTLVTTCLVLAPLMTRLLEQSILKPPFTLQRPVTTSIAIDASNALAPDATVALDEVYGSLGPEAKRLYPTGVWQWRVPDGVTPLSATGGGGGGRAGLLVRQDVCDHLRFDSGRCPSGAGEIAISTTDAEAFGWAVGQRRPWEGSGSDRGPGAPPVSLRIVGVYEQVPDEYYWLGTRLGGNALAQKTDVVVLDDWITAPATIEGLRLDARRTYVADPSAATVDALPRAVAQLEKAASSAGPKAQVSADLTDVVEEGTRSAAQIRVLVPLVLGQVVLLVLAVLVVVVRAAVDQRRREMGLARLRGASRSGVRRLIAAELVPPVVVGAPVGALAAIGIAELLRRLVLPPGVPFEIRPGLGVAVVVALLAGVAAVHLTILRAGRDSVSSLLRRLRVLPTAVGAATWVVAALAVAAVVVVLTSTDPTPLALATPTLLALAVGAMAAALGPRIAASGARASLGRGRASTALALAGIARRPAARGILVIVTVAVCTAVVAVDAWSVGERNRRLRAELEAGADSVIELVDGDVATVERTVRAHDPSRRRATVVPVTRPVDVGGVPMLSIHPDEAHAIAFPSALGDADLSLIAAPATSPVTMTGIAVSITARTSITSPSGSTAPTTVELVLTTPSGRVVQRPIPVPARSDGFVTARIPLLCEESCRFDGLRLTPPLPPTRDSTPEPGAPTNDSPAQAGTGDRLTVRRIAVDGRGVDVLDPDGWQSTNGFSAQAGDGGLVFTSDARGETREIRRGDVPRPMPAVVAGGLPASATGEEVDVKGPTPEPVRIRRVQEVGQLPGLGARGYLANLDVVGRRGISLASRDRVEVWFAPGEEALLDAVRADLVAGGTTIASERSYSNIKARYDSSGSAWGLSFALVGAALSLLVAAGFLVVTSALGRRAAATDVAALRLTGLPAATVRRAVALENVAVVTCGVVLGALTGVLGSLAAMPMLPLFTRAAARPLPHLAPAGSAVGAVVLVAAAMLLIVSVLLAGSVTRGASSRLVREAS